MEEYQAVVVGEGSPIPVAERSWINLDFEGFKLRHYFIVLRDHYSSNPILGRDLLDGVLHGVMVFQPVLEINKNQIEDFMSVKENYQHVEGEPAYLEPVSIKLKDGASIEKTDAKTIQR